MLLFISNNVSRKVGPLYVRAFSTGSGAFSQRISGVGDSFAKKNSNGNQVIPFLFEDSQKNRGKCYSTATTLNAGAVQQDLDSALDDLLQGTFDELEEIDDEPMKETAESVSAITPCNCQKELYSLCNVWQKIILQSKTAFEMVTISLTVINTLAPFSHNTYCVFFSIIGRANRLHRSEIFVYEQSSLDRSRIGSTGDRCIERKRNRALYSCAGRGLRPSRSRPRCHRPFPHWYRKNFGIWTPFYDTSHQMDGREGNS